MSMVKFQKADIVRKAVIWDAPNYLNMMSESIQNRSKEFAILESIGMTRKQIKKMIVFESLGYSIFFYCHCIDNWLASKLFGVYKL